MKSVILIVAALAGISSARCAAVRQEDVTPEKVCNRFETDRGNSQAKRDDNCRCSAQKCIEDQVKKSNVSDQVTRDDVTLCTFSPMIGNDTTDFMTVCDGLDVTRETCHSNTAWCVMDHAAWTKTRPDKNTALAVIQTCVAGRILKPDGDTLKNFVASVPAAYNMLCKKTDTSIKCNSTLAGADLGRTICSEDYFSETWDKDKWDEETELVNKCKEEFDRKTPKSDILKHTQLGQFCQDQCVECSECRWYLLDEEKGNKDFLGPYIRVMECQARAQTESKESCPSTPPADKQPGQPQQTLEEADRQLKEHCNRPEVNTKDCMLAGRRCAGQFKVDASLKEFLECVDTMPPVKPWELRPEK